LCKIAAFLLQNVEIEIEVVEGFLAVDQKVSVRVDREGGARCRLGTGRGAQHLLLRRLKRLLRQPGKPDLPDIARTNARSIDAVGELPNHNFGELVHALASDLRWMTGVYVPACRSHDMKARLAGNALELSHIPAHAGEVHIHEGSATGLLVVGHFSDRELDVVLH